MARLLFVEDEDDLRLLVYEALTDLGHDVTLAHDGDDAVRQLGGEARFDHVVTDISMPRGVSGLEVAAEAARLQPDARVLLVSGYQRSQLPSLPEGVRFLAKPYRLHQLLASLED